MTEFNLSKERRFSHSTEENGKVIEKFCYNEEEVKEFIKRLLTPNNISKGFVEVSTIKYYAGEKLICQKN